MSYDDRCQRCGHTRLDHGKADGSGRCRPCGKRCNAFVDRNAPAKSRATSGVRRRQRR